MVTPGLIEKAPLREELSVNQGDSRAHTEPSSENFTEECQTELPNQDTETKPRVSPSWGKTLGSWHALWFKILA